MKAIKALFLLAGLTISCVLSPLTSWAVAGQNLIANNSVESVDTSGNPISWSRGNWGNNVSSLSVSSTAHTGSNSLYASISSRTDGDAKWMHDTVGVTAGTSYTYTDWYMSNVATELDIQYTNTSGVISYGYLTEVPASATWKQVSATFTAPAGTTKVSVMHILATVGWLQTDDFSLSEPVPVTVTPDAGNMILNGSLETADGSSPALWLSSSWGTNTTNFEYLSEGHTGTKSVKLTVGNYSTGDAKWYFNPVTVQAGGQYKFSVWYKTNSSPKGVVMFTMTNGTVQYANMSIAVPSGDSTTWQPYTGFFAAPSGVKSATVFFLLDQNGWLQTDDYTLAQYTPQPFNRALLSITFDDGPQANITNALPLLNQYGFKTTHCYISGEVEGVSKTVINGVKSLVSSGHEICSHTVTHPFLTTISPSSLTYELQHSQQYLQSLTGQSISVFASPYGDYNTNVITEVKKYYRAHRSVDDGYNTKDNFDIYNLRVKNVLKTTTSSEVSAWIAQAQKDKSWLILVYHSITKNPDTYDTSVANFKQHLQIISASGIKVSTVSSALDEVVPQL